MAYDPTFWTEDQIVGLITNANILVYIDKQGAGATFNSLGGGTHTASGDPGQFETLIAQLPPVLSPAIEIVRAKFGDIGVAYWAVSRIAVIRDAIANPDISYNYKWTGFAAKHGY